METYQPHPPISVADTSIMAPHASTKYENASDRNDASDGSSMHMRIAAEGGSIQRQRDVFPFLDLPGELRNRVYDILAADAKEHPVTVRYRRWEAYEDPVSVGNYKHIARNTEQLGYSFSHSSFGLTQVCRKLRDEYLPVLRPIRHVLIRAADLYAYMGDFVPRLDDNVPLLRAPATIEVTRDPGRFTKLQLSRLAKWTKASEKLRFRFGKGLEVAGPIVDAFPAWERIGQALGFRLMTLLAWRELYGLNANCYIAVHGPPILHHAPSSSASSIDEVRLVRITHSVRAAGFFTSGNENANFKVLFQSLSGTSAICNNERSGMGYSLSLSVYVNGDRARSYLIPAQGVRNTGDLENCRVI